MAYGIKVSKPGVNVLEANVKDLLLDTSYPLLKVKASGSGTLSISDGVPDTDTITHNLGYVPRVLVYGQYYDIFSGNFITTYRRYPIQQQQVGVYNSEFYYNVTSTQLEITASYFDETSSSGSVQYFYYIFYDEQ